MKRTPYLFAISGVKNSGKTTLITKLIPEFTKKGLKVATIKHDGHDFEADVKGTDTYAHFEAGAYGTAIFSDHKYMIVKRQEHTKEEALIACFPEADLILLEGFKGSHYPKIEIIRDGNSNESVCKVETLIGIASDFAFEHPSVPVWDLNDAADIAVHIEQLINSQMKEKV
ncbi:MAG: molybdopterin-guanine dinucleotide biosynthesis protein B [Niameybacter sp.]|uniref:molybdopterin-guanine dinucleotide biosynthesis protein B n=1 Tax=Niameybacter sp. TaxID=2033640 RepID=UPI002FC86291